MSGRDKAYQYILDEMKNGNLVPGGVLNLAAITDALGISTTPLRDSLIQLEAEGYLTIHPRSKVTVNRLEYEDFPFLYEIMGALEHTIIAGSMEAYTEEKLLKMRKMNDDMRRAVRVGDMVRYDRQHYAFHDIFLQMRPNLFAARILKPIKNRLWDFPRKNFIQSWYLAAVDEHDMIIDAIANHDAASLYETVRNLHWGFAHNSEQIKNVYGF
ncbi:MAG: GntR family transcriptional regulator [Mailhella sp.]|nr:GntR family transcriptional regulator [Mailhella sp.]